MCVACCKKGHTSLACLTVLLKEGLDKLEEGLGKLRREVQELGDQLLSNVLDALGGKLDSLGQAVKQLEERSHQEEVLRELQATKDAMLTAVKDAGGLHAPSLRS